MEVWKCRRSNEGSDIRHTQHVCGVDGTEQRYGIAPMEHSTLVREMRAWSWRRSRFVRVHVNNETCETCGGRRCSTVFSTKKNTNTQILLKGEPAELSDCVV